MICPMCALAADTADYGAHLQCETECDCQHRCKTHGQTRCGRCMGAQVLPDAVSRWESRHRKLYITGQCVDCKRTVCMSPAGNTVYHKTPLRWVQVGLGKSVGIRSRCPGSGKKGDPLV